MRPYVPPVVPIDMRILQSCAVTLFNFSSQDSFADAVISHTTALSTLVRALDTCNDTELQDNINGALMTFVGNKKNLAGLIAAEISARDENVVKGVPRSSMRYLVSIMSNITSTAAWMKEGVMTSCHSPHPPLAKSTIIQTFSFPTASGIYLYFDHRSEFLKSELVLTGENSVVINLNENTSLPIKSLYFVGSKLSLKFKAKNEKQLWGYSFDIYCSYNNYFDEDGSNKVDTLSCIFSSSVKSEFIDYCLSCNDDRILSGLAKLLANLMYTPLTSSIQAVAKEFKIKLSSLLSKLIQLSSLEAIKSVGEEGSIKVSQLLRNNQREVARGLLGAIDWAEVSDLKQISLKSMELCTVDDVATSSFCSKIFFKLNKHPDLVKSGVDLLKSMRSNMDVLKVFLSMSDQESTRYGDHLPELFINSPLGFELTKHYASVRSNLLDQVVVSNIYKYISILKYGSR